MDLLPYVQRIASADQTVRRNELLAILRELDYPFVMYREILDEYRPENVIVRFQPEAPRRLVVGAHYDSVPGSTGANDNAAAVAVLLGLLQTYRSQPPAVPVDLVFFDLEELGMRGSRAYLARVSPQSVLAMINLDIVGAGTTIVVGPQRNLETWPLQDPIQRATADTSARFKIVEQLPPGDDWAFEEVGIPNVSVSILPDDDIPVLIDAVAAMRRHEQSAHMPAIMETMHNGPRDSIATIDETAMQSVLAWVAAAVRAFA